MFPHDNINMNANITPKEHKTRYQNYFIRCILNFLRHREELTNERDGIEGSNKTKNPTVQ